MKTIAVMNQKGGAGKSTLSVHVATAADLDGYPCALFDMDPQGTSEAWGRWRKKGTGLKTPRVTGSKITTLQDDLEEAAEYNAKVSVIDTPPLAQGEAIKAVALADLILIPCRPAIFDIHAMQLTVSLATSAKKPAYVVFNSGPPRPNAKIYDECAAKIVRLGIEVAPVRLSERAIFTQAVGFGQGAQEAEPDSKAAEEVAALWAWIKATLKLK